MNTPTSSSSLAAAATRTGKYERGEGQQKQPDRLQPGCNGQSPSFRRRPLRPSASLTPNCYTECLQHLHSSAINSLACVTRLLHTRALQTFLVSAPYSDCGAQSVTVPSRQCKCTWVHEYATRLTSSCGRLNAGLHGPNLLMISRSQPTLLRSLPPQTCGVLHRREAGWLARSLQAEPL